MEKQENSVLETSQKWDSRKRLTYATIAVMSFCFIGCVLMFATGGVGVEADASELVILQEKGVINAEALKAKKEAQALLELQLERTQAEVKALQKEKEEIRNSLDAYINSGLPQKKNEVVFMMPQNQK